MKQNILCLIICSLLVVCASFASAAIVVWDDDDPVSAASKDVSGTVTTPIADPTGAGRGTVGSVDVGGGSWWSGLGSAAPVVVGPETHGATFTFTFDYYVPAATTLEADDVNLYGQIDTDEGGNLLNSYGSLDVFSAPRDTWLTFSWSDVVPGTPSSIETLLLLDNGNTAPAAGAAFYLDKIHFEIIPVPEPASLGLLAIGITGIAALRRRRR